MPPRFRRLAERDARENLNCHRSSSRREQKIDFVEHAVPALDVAVSQGFVREVFVGQTQFSVGIVLLAPEFDGDETQCILPGRQGAVPGKNDFLMRMNLVESAPDGQLLAALSVQEPGVICRRAMSQ